MAEELVFDDITTGASTGYQTGDTDGKAWLPNTVCQTISALSAMLMMRRRSSSDETSPMQELQRGIASAIDVEVKRIIDESYDKAKSMIAEYRDVLDRCAALLLEKEKITRDEFEALFDEDSKTTVGHNI